MGWNPDYFYKIRGTWACRGKEQIIVFNLQNASPVMTVSSSSEEESVTKHRVELLPEEWEDSFGPEFYSHTLENGLYFIAPNIEWNSQAKSIMAPGIDQYAVTTEEQLQMTIENLMKGLVSSHAND